MRGSERNELTARVYAVYQQQLLLANAVDFDDLLLHVARMLRDNPELRASLDARFRFVLVDEYQDTNLAQYAIVRALSVDHRNLAVTGDPDQSIYGWRGANLNNILEFEHDYPDTRVVKLEQNFRSTQRIVEAANHLISFNRRRKPKKLFTENEVGSDVRQVRYPSHIVEAEDIADQIARLVGDGHCTPADIAIFYRTNVLSRSLEAGMRRRGIPYQIVRGLEFYQRREVKDVLAFLHLLNNPRHDAALRRVINVPPRGIGRATMQRLESFANQQGTCLLDAARHADFLSQVNKRTALVIGEFVRLQDELGRIVDQPVAQILNQVLEATGYLHYLEDVDDEPDVDRRGNVLELVNEAHEFGASRPRGPWLEAFLEKVSLVSDVDDWDALASKVSLMTLHAAKGLEFDVAFIVGVEEGLLPHVRHRDREDELEEERRLLFVGITRAKKALQLSHAAQRMRNGMLYYAVPSSFLMQLPPEGIARIGYSPTVGRARHFDDAVDVDNQVYGDEGTVEYADPPGLSSPASSVNRGPLNIPLVTAAEMISGKKGRKDVSSKKALPTDVDRFVQGMLVTHPEYGHGQIVALSGHGEKTKATVRFFRTAQEHTFYLAYTPLAPVGEKP
jgi:DNA helicase-2/ATP-dependent DNA helicase PcrA